MDHLRHSTPILFLASRILYSPLEALFTLLIFIFSKELNASALQLTVLACCKPLVSLIAFNTNAYIVGKPERIRSFLIGASFIGSFPSLFFPFIDNNWYYIASYAIFMAALKASFPGWIQILKSQIGLNCIGKVTTQGSSINYFIMIFIPLLFAGWMDQEFQNWKILFFYLALLQIFHLLLLSFLPTKSAPPLPTENLLASRLSLTIPWKEGWKLLKQNPHFAKYQVLFFLGGAGLVALQPILPIYFKETLHLSYTQLT